MTDFPTTPYPSEDGGDTNYTISIDNTLDRFTGSSLVIGDTVFLSQEGVEILASRDGNYNTVNAYSFRDVDAQEIGGLYGRDDAGQNVVGFRVVDDAAHDDDTVLEIGSISTTSAQATVTIEASRVTEGTDTYIYLERSAGSEIDIICADSGRVRLKPILQLVGADLAACDIYIKSTYFIIKYSDDGTTRYKYLDLSGTGATWTHGTSEPV